MTSKFLVLTLEGQWAIILGRKGEVIRVRSAMDALIPPC